MYLTWTTVKKLAARCLESSDHGSYIMMDGASSEEYMFCALSS